MKLKRPILIGGLGLSAGLWLLDSFQQSLFDTHTLLTTVVVGSGIWWWQRRRTQAGSLSIASLVVDQEMVDRALTEADGWLQQLSTEVGAAGMDSDAQLGPSLEELRHAQTQLRQGMSRQNLQFGISGSRDTGKSALLKHLMQTWVGTQSRPVTVVELVYPASLSLEGSQASTLSTTPPDLTNLTTLDGIVYLVTGDITDSDWTALNALVQQSQSVLVVFNKQDLYLPLDRTLITQRIQGRVSELPLIGEVVAIAAAPKPIQVRRPLSDGQWETHQEAPEADILALTDALTHIAQHQADTLRLRTTLRQINHHKQAIHDLLNQVRRTQAIPVVEQYQWIAAASAFANPLPSLDLLATGAITGQLIVDLGAVYGQRFTLDQAKAAAGTLASLMVNLGLVELSTQVLTGVLKSHLATYVAGGVVQGASAAYLTRLAGLSLIEYFEEQPPLGTTESRPLAWESIGAKLQALFQQNRQGSMLTTLAQQSLRRLLPQEAALATAPDGNSEPLSPLPSNA